MQIKVGVGDAAPRTISHLVSRGGRLPTSCNHRTCDYLLYSVLGRL